MAKFLVHAFVHRIIGKFGDLVVRKRNGQLFISRAPEPSTKPPSEGQIDVRARFKLASVYANAAADDPVASAFYQPIAGAHQSSIYSAAMADYLRPPAVEKIDVSGYAGAVGGKIVVVAADDSGVASVHVEIRTPAGVVLEQGQAAAANGAWTYTATTNLTANQSVVIVATAKDRPGNTALKQQTYQKP